jgi:hypothetical protein
MSSLRARCPNCRTFTAVAIGDGYECHRCGSTFAAGLVRVPAAWGSGGEGMAEGARVALPYPEAAIVERDPGDRPRRLRRRSQRDPSPSEAAAARTLGPQPVSRAGSNDSP